MTPGPEQTPTDDLEIKQSKRLRCCRKSKSDDLMEHVSIHLDNFGKHGLTLVYSLMQFSSIFTFCLMYYDYYTHTCNPAVYKVEKDLMHLSKDIHFDLAL